MNEEIVAEFLNAKTEDEFVKVFISQKVEYDMHKELWDERVIEHYMKILKKKMKHICGKLYKYNTREE